jgi:hypothetical protein
LQSYNKARFERASGRLFRSTLSRVLSLWAGCVLSWFIRGDSNGKHTSSIMSA